jgi:putative membrane protein
MKLNKSELKWFIILIGFTWYTYNLISTGKIYFFLNPKMIKYVHFSFIIFLILCIFQIRRLFISAKNNRRDISFYLFILPLFLGIFVNPQGLNTEIASKRGAITIGQNISTTAEPVLESQSTNAKSTIQNEPTNALIINGKNFTHITDDLTYNNPNKYKGKEVVITGFVYRDNSYSKNQFLISRLMMVCCAADTEVTGILCDWNKASIQKSNTWVKVTGKIDLENLTIDGEKSITPVIRIQNVEPYQEPKNQYIYPE